MKTRHFLQVGSEIIGKHRYRPQGLIESKTKPGLTFYLPIEMRQAIAGFYNLDV